MNYLNIANIGENPLNVKEDCIYLGYWELLALNKEGKPTTTNVVAYVYFEPNPDFSKGHSHYVAYYRKQSDYWYVTNAELTMTTPFDAIVENAVVYVSRYRHDFCRTPSGFAIDGVETILRLLLLVMNYQKLGDLGLLQTHLNWWGLNDRLRKEAKRCAGK